MALALRLRRAAVALSSSVLRDQRPHPSISITSSRSLPLSDPSVAPTLLNPILRANSLIQSHFFRSSPPASSGRRTDSGGQSEIGPDEILFEGCDYNHWLITMDFPKDPKPTPEEMVETYVQTLAKVVGSVEEAKKRMYACSTTTYHGFQAVMTEEMSEKFRGLPGVVFILPDSYIDPVNKEYGGDKYDNGVITPRPPPIQYRPQGRYGDRNRNYNQPRNNWQRDQVPAQQGYPPRDRQAPMQGDGRNYAPQQNYGPPGQDGRGYGPPGGREFSPSGERRDFGQGEQREYAQPGGRDFNQGQRGDGRNYTPQQNYGPPGQDGRGYGPPGGREFSPSGERRDFGQGEQRDYAQPGGRDFNQGQRGNYAPQEQRNFTQGQGGDFGYPGASGTGYRQGPDSSYSTDNRQGAGPGYGGQYNQGSGSGYGQSLPGLVEGENESSQGKY